MSEATTRWRIVRDVGIAGVHFPAGTVLDLPDAAIGPLVAVNCIAPVDQRDTQRVTVAPRVSWENTDPVRVHGDRTRGFFGDLDR